MLKIENTEVYGWKAALRGLRNPLNSWARSDTAFFDDGEVILGNNDFDLCNRMNVSTEQSKYRRMITVTMDVTAPLFWWKEFDTYKVGTVCNSCSTMHKIHAKEFVLDDFSYDTAKDDNVMTGVINITIDNLNKAREFYLKTKDKKYWRYMIELLPTSYNQKRTIQLNYEVLAQIFRQRKNHKLTEWHTFCDWIKSLQYSELITGILVESQSVDRCVSCGNIVPEGRQVCASCQDKADKRSNQL